MTDKTKGVSAPPQSEETTIKMLEGALRETGDELAKAEARYLAVAELAEQNGKVADQLRARNNELTSTCQTLSETNSRINHDEDHAKLLLNAALTDLAMMVGVLHARGLPLPPLVTEPYLSMARDAGREDHVVETTRKGGAWPTIAVGRPPL